MAANFKFQLQSNCVIIIIHKYMGDNNFWSKQTICIIESVLHCEVLYEALNECFTKFLETF